ncbi:MAG: hypothetical protein HQL46_08190 [Gammaproteobacteria bacterium]|nr:hypothetical protein [Gammaproteobacteria bacterium]
MSIAHQILVVNNNCSSQDLLSTMLDEQHLVFCDSYNEAKSILLETTVDLIIISLSSPSQEGYKEGLELSGIPVFFLMCDKTIEIKKNINFFYIESIRDIDVKPMFNSMIKHTIEKHHDQLKHQGDLSEVTDAMLNLQTDNAKLYDICRFLQRSFFCQDINALCDELFTVTRSFDIRCTLSIHSDKHHFFISDGIKHTEQMNIDILKMAANEARIFQFGHNRAVFNWTCASLLVNKVGSDVDNLALLMDGFEMGFNAIESVDEFNHVLEEYREQNFQLNLKVSKIVGNVATNITNNLNQLGAMAMLSVEQEDELVAIAESGRSEVDDLFSEGSKLEEKFSAIMTDMRTQKEGTAESSEVSSHTDNDGLDSIDFF